MNEWMHGESSMNGSMDLYSANKLTKAIREMRPK